MKRKKILVICPSPPGTNPGQRLKYEQYFSHWIENGYDITVSPFQTHRFWKIIYKKGYFAEKVCWVIWGYLLRIRDLFRIPFYDGLYIYMAVTPLGPPVFEWLVTRLNQRIIFDMEDMAFTPAVSEANKIIGFLKGTRKYTFMIRKAKHVIVSTPALAKMIQKQNPNVTDILATFDTNRFSATSNYIHKEVTIIGWTGSQTTIPYLHLLDNVFRRVAALRPIQIIAISNSTYRCEGVNVENIVWSEANEIKDLHRIDIGVYPVPMEPWVLGKSGCKAITYMSVAIPCIATRYGNVVEQVIHHDVNGILVETEDEWVDAIIHLIDHPEDRKRLGTAGREKIINCFSVDATKQKYLQIIESII